jgi:hypothetical protein
MSNDLPNSGVHSEVGSDSSALRTWFDSSDYAAVTTLEVKYVDDKIAPSVKCMKCLRSFPVSERKFSDGRVAPKRSFLVAVSYKGETHKQQCDKIKEVPPPAPIPSIVVPEPPPVASLSSPDWNKHFEKMPEVDVTFQVGSTKGDDKENQVSQVRCNACSKILDVTYYPQSKYYYSRSVKAHFRSEHPEATDVNTLMGRVMNPRDAHSVGVHSVLSEFKEEGIYLHVSLGKQGIIKCKTCGDGLKINFTESTGDLSTNIRNHLTSNNHLQLTKEKSKKITSFFTLKTRGESLEIENITPQNVARLCLGFNSELVDASFRGLVADAVKYANPDHLQPHAYRAEGQHSFQVGEKKIEVHSYLRALDCFMTIPLQQRHAFPHFACEKCSRILTAQWFQRIIESREKGALLNRPLKYEFSDFKTKRLNDHVQHKNKLATTVLNKMNTIDRLNEKIQTCAAKDPDVEELMKCFCKLKKMGAVLPTDSMAFNILRDTVKNSIRSIKNGNNHGNRYSQATKDFQLNVGLSGGTQAAGKSAFMLKLMGFSAFKRLRKKAMKTQPFEGGKLLISSDLNASDTDVFLSLYRRQ